jgi:hypothetical protein
MNADQGRQFTSFAWADRLRREGVRISMDGKGRFLDNILVGRLWRSLKYEGVCLHAWETGSQAKAGVGKPKRVSANGPRSTTESVLIPPLAAGRQPWSVGWEKKKSKPISRSKK